MAHGRRERGTPRKEKYEIGELEWHPNGVHLPPELWHRASPEIQREVARVAAAFEGKWPEGKKIRIHILPKSRRVEFGTDDGRIIKQMILSEEVIEYTTTANVRLIMQGIGIIGNDGNVRVQRFGFAYEVQRWRSEIVHVFMRAYFGGET